MARQSDERLRGEEVTVHTLFSTADRRLRAPEFQRHFVWGTDQINRFWDDFDSLKDEGTGTQEDSLFLGALVVQPVEIGGGGRTPLYSVIDGQQRILTLYLILTAIAEGFQDAGDFDKASDLASEYLLVRTGKFKRRPRVESTVADSDQLAKILSCLTNPRPEVRGLAEDEEVSGNLLDAWITVRKRVRELGSDDEGKLSSSLLESLRIDIVDRIELVEVILGQRHDPHQVYERLNDAGARLRPIDLIRNEVFLTAGADADVTDRVFREKWEPFEQLLGTEHQDAYFFPYTLIRRPSATKASTYRTLKGYWREDVTKGERGEGPAGQIVADLQTFVPAFRAVAGVARPASIDDVAWDAVRRLSRMDTPPMMYPYLMQLVHAHLQDNEMVDGETVRQIIDLLDAFIVRRAFAGFGNAGVHTAFNDMWRRAGADPTRLLELIARPSLHFTDDEGFAEHIREFGIASSKRCRYILTEYERALDEWERSEWDPNDITVDHVMPQNPNLADWQDISQEDRSRLVHTWANLVPLTGPANPAKGNMKYTDARQRVLEKQATVFKSTYKLYYENTTWTADDIERRATELVKFALRRWPKSV